MEKYQKILKKYYKQKKNRKKNTFKLTDKKRKTYFDSLFTRIFLSSFILLIFVIFNSLFEIDIHSIINTNYNFTKIGYQIVYFFKEDNTEEMVSGTEYYETINYNNNINTFISNSFNGVVNLKSGTIIKIEKNDDLYNVTIQTIDDELYTYIGLTSINCYLYEYVPSDTIIGSSNYINSNYQFDLSIFIDNKYYSYDKL